MGLGEETFIKMLSERNNPVKISKKIGIVIKEFPELSVQLDAKLPDFTSEQIMIFDFLLPDYERDIEIELGGEIEDEYSESILEPNDRKLKSSKSQYKLKGSGKTIWTNGLKKGTQVLCEVLDNGDTLLVYGALRRLNDVTSNN